MVQKVGESKVNNTSMESNIEPAQAKVAILLCTFNGQEYLSEQLESFASQAYLHWEVWASDDGSNDGTLTVLESFQKKWGKDRLRIQSGPKKGFATNFLSLTCDTAIQASYYAYSDQDDVWEANKISRAVEWLSKIPAHVPALYCSRTRLVDADNNEVGLSPIFTRRPSFSNALVQNIGGGNTMVFNDAARKLLCEAGDDIEVVAHDRWVYLVVTACGGMVFHDTYPTIRYRQHGENLMGSNISLNAKLVRLRLLVKGSFKKWNDQYVQALQHIRPRLTSENIRILDDFGHVRNSWLLPRLIGILRCRVYRQSLLGNIGLLLAVLLKRI